MFSRPWGVEYGQGVPDYRVLVAALAFLLLVVWRVRPAFSGEEVEPPVRGLEAAKDDDARAELLADAGDRFARALGGGRKAAACYSRAMRIKPGSTELARRAVAALQRHPKVLEALLWRRLGAVSWAGDTRPVAELLWGGLSSVYGASSRTRPRAQAIEHMLTALGVKVAERGSPTESDPQFPQGKA